MLNIRFKSLLDVRNCNLTINGYLFFKMNVFYVKDLLIHFFRSKMCQSAYGLISFIPTIKSVIELNEKSLTQVLLLA